MYAPPVQRLITELSKLPGVGCRTAQRLAFHLLRSSDEEALALAGAIREVKGRIGLCEVCFNLTDEASEAEVLSGEELVRRFLEEFDAEEILEDEPEQGEARTT